MKNSRSGGWSESDLHRLTEQTRIWLKKRWSGERSDFHRNIASEAVERMIMKHPRVDVRSKPETLACAFAKRVRLEKIREERRQSGQAPIAAKRLKMPPKGYDQPAPGRMWRPARLVPGSPEADKPMDGAAIPLTEQDRTTFSMAADNLSMWFRAIADDVRRMGSVQEKRLEALRVTYHAVHGVYLARSIGPWVSMARDLAQLLEAALCQEGAGLNPEEEMRKTMRVLNAQPNIWHATEDEIVALVRHTSLSRGGRGRKDRRGIRTVVADYINGVRSREEGLAPLTPDDLWPVDE